MTNTLHAHVSTESADCDGRYNNDYITEINDTEAASEYPEEDFKSRVLSGQVGWCSDVRVDLTENGFSSHEVTEEGYRQATVVWCSDDCDFTKRGYRDHTAESMGY